MPTRDKVEWKSYVNANNFNTYLIVLEKTNISLLTYQWLGNLMVTSQIFSVTFQN
jgi:hypothetical protein